MKKSELKQIIKEEIHKVFSEIKIEKPIVPFINKKLYNITVKNNNYTDYNGYDDYYLNRIDPNDLVNLEYDRKTDKYYIFISHETGEIIEIPKNKLDSYQLVSEENINEIKIEKPSLFETLRRNLIKLIEFNRDNYGYDDDDFIEDTNETIEDLENATTENELRKIIKYWVDGAESDVQYYFDLATYKEKFNNPLLNT